jgi:carbohydrate-selective porin OprB
MKIRWLATIPVSLTFLLVFIIFIPVVQTLGGTYTSSSPTGSVVATQYASISYAYGGWGAIFQTGVNWYNVNGWMCSCPDNSTECCIAPFAGIIWTVVGLLSLADLLSIVVITRRLTRG